MDFVETKIKELTGTIHVNHPIIQELLEDEEASRLSKIVGHWLTSTNLKSIREDVPCKSYMGVLP